MWRNTGIIGGALLCLLGLVVGVNTVLYQADRPVYSAVPAHAVSAETITRLSAALQIQTDSSLTDVATRSRSFQQFHAFLEQSFPLLHRKLKLQRFNEFALLYSWQGSDSSLKPMLLLSHQDVVPIERATQADWQYPAFSGAIANGYVWGRGAWDDKSTLMATLEALELLLSEGFAPQRSIVLAFGHDEEVGGEQGAGAISRYLLAQGIRFEFILDEGTTIAHDLMPGITAPIAMIGVAEKGYLTLELLTEDAGGHSSVPPKITAAGRVARAISRLQAQPLPASLNQPVREMLDALGPHMPWSKRIWLANLWLFEPLVVNQLAAKRTTSAYVRTTTAPTMLAAGIKENVLPQSARAVVNFRIAPGQTRAAVLEQVRQIIADDQVSVRQAGAISSEPSAVTPRDAYGFEQIQKAIRQVRPDVLVSPALLFGATDSRHYAALTEHIYRFTPISMGPEDIKRIHGTNERIAIVDYENAIRFYYQLMSNTSMALDPAANQTTH